MRFLHITDTHYRASNPSGRKDDFPTAIQRKVQAALTWGMGNGIDAVLCSGDLYDSFNVAPVVGTRLAEMIQATRIPWKVIPGGHDLLSKNLALYDATMMGLLAVSLGPALFEILPDAWNGGIADIGGVRVAGFHYRERGEGDVARGLESVAGKADIAMFHQMVVEAPKPVGFDHALVQTLPCCVPLSLFGDYHPGVARYEQNCTFINPGAVARMKRISSDMDRQPAALVIDTDIRADNGSYGLKMISLPCERDVWHSDADLMQMQAGELQQFREHLGQLDAEKMSGYSPEQMVQVAAQQGGWDPEIVQLALGALGEVEE